MLLFESASTVFKLFIFGNCSLASDERLLIYLAYFYRERRAVSEVILTELPGFEED
jgi:hypothetical protein